MKLVITTAYLTLRGGLEKVLLNVARHYDAKIYTAEYKKNETFPEYKDLDIEVVPTSRIFKLMPYGRISQGLNYGTAFYNLKIKDDYDVLNPHQAPSHWVRHGNERVLWYCHTPLRDVWDLYQFRLSLKKPHQKPIYILGAKAVRTIDRNVVKEIESIVANSSNTRSRVVEYFDRKDTKVLGGGIEYKLYKNNGDDKYFYYPSRISPNKRQLYAIKAFEMFKKKKKGYKLYITGAVSQDKFYHDYYKEVVEEAKRVGDVIIKPNVPERSFVSMYSGATAVLFTAMNEDYGLVPLEAMSAEKPVISVNEGGPKDTVLNGRTGYLVNSAEEMAKKMLFVAEHPSIASSMGKLGRKRVIEHYSWDRFFKEFDKELERVKKM